MRSIKIAVIMLIVGVSVLAKKHTGGDDIVGIWLTSSKEANVTIFKTGKYYYGKISWIKEPMDATGKPKTDTNNPDETLRSKPLMNLLMLKSFEFNATDEVWENGTIYDPKNGKTYSCKMEMVNLSTLEVRGYIGISLVGRTDTWTKVE